MSSSGAPDGARARRELRTEGFRARRAIGGVDRDRRERLIVSHLLSVHVGPAATVAVSIGDDGEPDLSGFHSAARQAGHTLALPVLEDDPGDFSMRFVPWHSDDTLRPGRYGIACPPDRAAVIPDLVIVPLVRFDSAGNRMGRGAGFYDRYLGKHRLRSVGAAFEAQRSDQLPTQEHDVRLDAIVTEVGLRFARPTGVR